VARPEIGSEAWARAEVAAGRIPQERDRYGSSPDRGMVRGLTLADTKGMEMIDTHSEAAREKLLDARIHATARHRRGLPKRGERRGPGSARG
jgi:hypothetical protein